VPPDRLARLFEPQPSAKPGGSGLGLAITRQLVLALGGTIALVTTGPQGSLFRVELPSAVVGVAPEAEDG
jgi:signal transduction histidine kinase